VWFDRLYREAHDAYERHLAEFWRLAATKRPDGDVQ